ncbi:MAG: hypothetical protein JWL73_1644 [Actinomycetia bacterium]|nr:hypothetical protein [Actinomycetes bacterium]
MRGGYIPRHMAATEDPATIAAPFAPPRLHASTIVRSAISIYRREFAKVIALAVVVLGSAAVIDTFVDLQAERSHLDTWAYAVIIAATGLSTVGATFYAGMLDALVGRAAHGHARQGVAVVLRTVPYVNLIVADLLLTLAELGATIAFIVPGIVLTTYLGIAGPVISIERLGPVAGLHRSVQLVRGSFWLVFFLCTVPVAIEHELVALVQSLVSEHSYALIFFERGVFGALVVSVVGIIEVELAYALIARHRAAGAVPAAGSVPVVDDDGVAHDVLHRGVPAARDDPEQQDGAEERAEQGSRERGPDA